MAGGRRPVVGGGRRWPVAGGRWPVVSAARWWVVAGGGRWPVAGGRWCRRLGGASPSACKAFRRRCRETWDKGRWAEAACPAQLRASDTVCPSHHEGGACVGVGSRQPQQRACHKSVYVTWRSHRWPECLLDRGKLQTVQDACAGNVGRSDVMWAFTASVPTRGYPTVTCFLETKKCKYQPDIKKLVKTKTVCVCVWVLTASHLEDNPYLWNLGH